MLGGVAGGAEHKEDEGSLTMNIDLSKVNLLEKDVENWIYENPDQFSCDGSTCGPIERWIGRQYTLPSGIVDLIGVNSKGYLVIIEVKNVPITKAALTQVTRYATDIAIILARHTKYQHRSAGLPIISTCVVGTEIDRQTFMEACAMAIDIVTFQPVVELAFATPPNIFIPDYYARLAEIGHRPEWQLLGARLSESAANEVDSDGDANPAAQDEYDELLDAITGEQDALGNE